jgi:hypothetical protein
MVTVTTTSSGQADKKSAFGQAGSLCKLIRPAVGEWKIQLGLLVAESCTLSEDKEICERERKNGGFNY